MQYTNELPSILQQWKDFFYNRCTLTYTYIYFKYSSPQSVSQKYSFFIIILEIIA